MGFLRHKEPHLVEVNQFSSLASLDLAVLDLERDTIDTLELFRPRGELLDLPLPMHMSCDKNRTSKAVGRRAIAPLHSHHPNSHLATRIPVHLVFSSLLVKSELDFLCRDLGLHTNPPGSQGHQCSGYSIVPVFGCPEECE